jgi:hypothetical protein
MLAEGYRDCILADTRMRVDRTPWLTRNRVEARLHGDEGVEWRIRVAVDRHSGVADRSTLRWLVQIRDGPSRWLTIHTVSAETLGLSDDDIEDQLLWADAAYIVDVVGVDKPSGALPC